MAHAPINTIRALFIKKSYSAPKPPESHQNLFPASLPVCPPRPHLGCPLAGLSSRPEFTCKALAMLPCSPPLVLDEVLPPGRRPNLLIAAWGLDSDTHRCWVSDLCGAREWGWADQLPFLPLFHALPSGEFAALSERDSWILGFFWPLCITQTWFFWRGDWFMLLMIWRPEILPLNCFSVVFEKYFQSCHTLIKIKQELCNSLKANSL